MCMILSKALDPVKVRLIYDDESNSTLAELTLQLVKLWIDQYVEQDSFILGSVVELVETLLHSQRVWQMLKQSPMTTNRLLTISKRPTINAFVKTKIVQVVSLITR